jgi:hypothetical protein
LFTGRFTSYDTVVSTLQERLQWVLETRNVAAGALSLQAGLARSHVGAILRGREISNLREPTARKLAKAANVSVAWLMTGQGPREPYTEEGAFPLYPEAASLANDPFPSRTQVLMLLRGTVSDKVLDALRVAIPPEKEDPGRDWWIGHTRELVRDLKAIEAEFGEPSEPSEAGLAKREEEQATLDTSRAVAKTRPRLEKGGSEGKGGHGGRMPMTQAQGKRAAPRPKSVATLRGNEG